MNTETTVSCYSGCVTNSLGAKCLNEATPLLCPHDDPAISGGTCVAVKSNDYMGYMCSLKGTNVTMFSVEFVVSQTAVFQLWLSFMFAV